MSLSYVPDDIPLRGGGGGIFIPPFVRIWVLKGHFLSDPLPSFFSRVSKKKSNLWPPLTSKVKENLITFPKEQIELCFVASYGKAIHPNVRHPTLEGGVVVLHSHY